jgi:5-methylcytosine-specific restriction enzyme subunit McrC
VGLRCFHLNRLSLVFLFSIVFIWKFTHLLLFDIMVTNLAKKCREISCNRTINICQLILQGMLQTTEQGEHKLASFVDEQRMCRLYEKFILEYYSKEFPALNVSASQIPWALDDGIGTMLPIMQSDITLARGNEVLIIDAKYYTHTTQVQFDVHTLHSSNLYQIFTYVKNKDSEFGEKPHKVSGMLLYAKTDETIQPDNAYQMSGNKISVKTLDLNLQFVEIAAQLNRIVEEHFGLNVV